MAETPVKPNLFIAGAGKCGTSAWHKYLATHPDIFFAEMKEPNYFACDLPRTRLVESQSEYESLFERGRDARFAGEASCIYLYSTVAAERIRNYNPDARILLFLRPQEHFVPSVHHQHLFKFVECIEDFETAWKLSGNRSPESLPPTCPDPAMVDYAALGDFHTQVGRFLDAFPPEQILITDFDYWVSNPRAAYLRILEFLGLEDDGRTEFPRINEAKSYRIKWLGRLISHPPYLLELPVRVLRKLTGRSALGLGERASKLIAAPGYRTEISPGLREEIRRHYEEGNRRLKERLSKVGLAWN